MGNEILQDSGKVYVAATWIDRKALEAVKSALGMHFDDRCAKASKLAANGAFEAATLEMNKAAGIMAAVNYLEEQFR